MRALVATNQFQGNTRGDFSHTVEGELVLVEISECDRPDECGCGRGWPGMASRQATTTAMVVDLPHLTETDLRQVIEDWLVAAGWEDLFRDVIEDRDDHDCDHGHVGRDDGLDGDGALPDVDAMLGALVDEHVDLIADVCQAFPVGTVLERRGTIVAERSWPAAA